MTVVSAALEIGSVRGSAIFRVQRDGALEMRDCPVLVAPRVCNREHVDGVIVVGILVAHDADARSPDRPVRR
jgi:hypothetical protein